MAAANIVLVLEVTGLLAIGALWAIHLWASRSTKDKLYKCYDRVVHRLIDGQTHPY